MEIEYIQRIYDKVARSQEARLHIIESAFLTEVYWTKGKGHVTAEPIHDATQRLKELNREWRENKKT